MKMRNRNRTVGALVLLLSLLLPLMLDAAHYLLFEHHEHSDSGVLSFHKKESSHILCSYPFVTEEFSVATIEIQRPELLLHTFTLLYTPFVKGLRIFTVQGRAPPFIA